MDGVKDYNKWCLQHYYCVGPICYFCFLKRLVVWAFDKQHFNIQLFILVYKKYLFITVCQMPKRLLN
jgi:hypothetical protein